MSRRHGRWDLLHLQSGNADLVPADGFSIRDLARTLRQIQHNLDDVRTRLLRAHDADAWVGEAAKASVEKSHTVVKQLAKSSTKFESGAGALETYAPAVDEARSVTRSALVLVEDAERRRIEFKDLGGQAAEAIGHAAGGVVDAIANFRAPKISLPHPHFW